MTKEQTIEKIKELREKGCSYQAIGDAMGYTRQRIHQLYRDMDKPKGSVTITRNLEKGVEQVRCNECQEVLVTTDLGWETTFSSTIECCGKEIMSSRMVEVFDWNNPTFETIDILGKKN